MDVVLARTFLEVIAAGSFAAAAHRLNVTQSAVSIRVQRLEDELGQRLFTRSKSGVNLTIHGQHFEPQARTLIQVWEEARYSIAIPDAYRTSLSIGCESSLWPELSINWLENMEATLEDVAFNVHIAPPDRLTRMMTNGLLDVAVIYTPELRPGLKATYLMADSLVQVTGNPDHRGGLDDSYVFMDWGQEFVAAHSRWYPDFKLSRTSLQLGAEVVPYIIRNKRSAYLPYRVADDHIAAGALFFVPGAPEMSFPAYAVWTTGRKQALIAQALDMLAQAADAAPMIALRRPNRRTPKTRKRA